MPKPWWSSRHRSLIIVGFTGLILFLIFVPILPPQELYIGSPRCVAELDRAGITCSWVRYSITFLYFGFGGMATYYYGWVRYYLCVPQSGQIVSYCVIFDLNH